MQMQTLGFGICVCVCVCVCVVVVVCVVAVGGIILIRGSLSTDQIKYSVYHLLTKYIYPQVLGAEHATRLLVIRKKLSVPRVRGEG